MRQKDKLLLNIGFLFFAFGFALNSHVLMTWICSVTAVILAIQAHSLHVFQTHLRRIILIFSIEVLCIHVSYLNRTVPWADLMAFASLVSAVLWMESSEKVIGRVMKGMIVVMLVFFGLSLSLNETVYGTEDTCLITALLFMPFTIGYLNRECRYRIAHLHENEMRMEEKRILQ